MPEPPPEPPAPEPVVDLDALDEQLRLEGPAILFPPRLARSLRLEGAVAVRDALALPGGALLVVVESGDEVVATAVVPGHRGVRRALEGDGAFAGVARVLEAGVPVGRFEPRVFGSLPAPGAELLLAVAIVLAVRARRGDGGLALPAFGVAWFLGTLSVESGIVPLPMIMCEYRVYLPSAGFFIAVLSGGAYLILTYAPGWRRGAGAAVLVVAPLLLGSAAYARNGVWATTTSLWEDTVRKNPSSAAVRNALAVFYLEAGPPDDALREYASTLTMGFEHPKVYNYMGLAYFQLGRYAEAAEHYQAALRSYPQYAEALYGLANVFARQNRLDDAVREYPRRFCTCSTIMLRPVIISPASMSCRENMKRPGRS